MFILKENRENCCKLKLFEWLFNLQTLKFKNFRVQSAHEANGGQWTSLRLFEIVQKLSKMIDIHLISPIWTSEGSVWGYLYLDNIVENLFEDLKRPPWKWPYEHKTIPDCNCRSSLQIAFRSCFRLSLLALSPIWQCSHKHFNFFKVRRFKMTLNTVESYKTNASLM